MKNKKLIFLSMIIISIFTIKNTNAKTIKNTWIEYDLNYVDFTATGETKSSYYNIIDLQPNSNWLMSYLRLDMKNEGVTIPQNANYFTIPFSITDLKNDSNKLVCTGQQTTQTTYSFAFQTTYTDGTTSQNDGVINEGLAHPTFCNQWQVESLNDYSINANYSYDNRTHYTNCQIVNTGKSYNLLCPIDRNISNNNNKITNVSFVITRKNNDNTTKLRFVIGEYITFEIDEQYEILQKINEINNKLNQDISEEDKQQPNTANYENSKQQEENIKNSISNANPNDITFNTDLTATSKIWEIVTNFLNTNSKVMGLMISILSLGVIKMILNR